MKINSLYYDKKFPYIGVSPTIRAMSKTTETRGRPPKNPEDRRSILIQWGSSMEYTETDEMRRRLEIFLAESTPPDQLKSRHHFEAIMPQMENIEAEDWEDEAQRHQLAITPIEFNLVRRYAQVGNVSRSAIMRRAMAGNPIKHLDGQGGRFVAAVKKRARPPSAKNKPRKLVLDGGEVEVKQRNLFDLDE